MIDRYGKRETVTIDRLKVAHVEPASSHESDLFSDESTQPMIEETSISDTSPSRGNSTSEHSTPLLPNAPKYAVPDAQPTSQPEGPSNSTR